MENGNEQAQVGETTENNVSTGEDLQAVKAQLDEEKTAKAEALQSVAEKNARIDELEAALSEAKQGSEAKATELEASAAEIASLKEVRDQALGKYLGMAKALNPTIPEGIIAGATIAEIDASIEKGKAIVEAVKKAMEAEAAAGKVPAGAPTREAISTEGLSPREKIAAGIQPKNVVA